MIMHWTLTKFSVDTINFFFFNLSMSINHGDQALMSFSPPFVSVHGVCSRWEGAYEIVVTTNAFMYATIVPVIVLLLGDLPVTPSADY